MKFFYTFFIPLCVAAESDKLVEYIKGNSIYKTGVNREIEESEGKEVINVNVDITNVVATYNISILEKEGKKKEKHSDDFDELVKNEEKKLMKKISSFAFKHDGSVFYIDNDKRITQDSKNRSNQNDEFYKENESTNYGNDKVRNISSFENHNDDKSEFVHSNQNYINTDHKNYIKNKNRITLTFEDDEDVYLEMMHSWKLIGIKNYNSFDNGSGSGKLGSGSGDTEFGNGSGDTEFNNGSGDSVGSGDDSDGTGYDDAGNESGSGNADTNYNDSDLTTMVVKYYE